MFRDHRFRSSCYIRLHHHNYYLTETNTPFSLFHYVLTFHPFTYDLRHFSIIPFSFNRHHTYKKTISVYDTARSLVSPSLFFVIPKEIYIYLFIAFILLLRGVPCLDSFTNCASRSCSDFAIVQLEDRNDLFEKKRHSLAASQNSPYLLPCLRRIE